MIRRAFATPRRDAPESCMYLSPPRGRGECRVPAAPAAPCARVESTGVEATGTPESPGIPARNGFNGFLRALPGDEFLLPPSPCGLRFVQARSGRRASADLTPTTGARTTRLRRTHQRRSSCVPSMTHGKPALPSQSRARRCRVHRIPSRVRDDRDTPLEWDETARVIKVIWVWRERKYFCKRGWTEKSHQPR